MSVSGLHRGQRPTTPNSLQAGGFHRPRPVLTGLQACQTAFQASRNLNQYRGIYWEVGANGTTMFNTIVPPNSNHYTWGLPRRGRRLARPGDLRQRLQPPPRRRQHPDGRRQRQVHQGHVNTTTWWALGTRAGGESSAPTRTEPAGDPICGPNRPRVADPPRVGPALIRMRSVGLRKCGTSAP